MEMFRPKIGEKRKEALAMPGAHTLLIEEDKVLCDIIKQNVHAHGHHVWIMSHMCLEESCTVPHGAAQGHLLDVLSLPVACDFLVHGPRIVGSRSIISANLAHVGFPCFDSAKTGRGQDA